MSSCEGRNHAELSGNRRVSAAGSWWRISAHSACQDVGQRFWLRGRSALMNMQGVGGQSRAIKELSLCSSTVVSSDWIRGADWKPEPAPDSNCKFLNCWLLRSVKMFCSLFSVLFQSSRRHGEHAGADPVCQRDAEAETGSGPAEDLPAGLCAGGSGNSHRPGPDCVPALYIRRAGGPRDAAHAGPGAEWDSNCDTKQPGVDHRGGGGGRGSGWRGLHQDPDAARLQKPQVQPAKHNQPPPRVLGAAGSQQGTLFRGCSSQTVWLQRPPVLQSCSCSCVKVKENGAEPQSGTLWSSWESRVNQSPEKSSVGTKETVLSAQKVTGPDWRTLFTSRSKTDFESGVHESTWKQFKSVSDALCKNANLWIFYTNKVCFIYLIWFQFLANTLEFSLRNSTELW